MKKVLALIITVTVAAALFCLRDDISVYFVHLNNKAYVDNYEETSVQKGEYTFYTKVLEQDGTKSVSFYITKQDEIVFESEDGWRVSDLKYIGFKEESYDVLVESGDVGTAEYIFNGETWVEQNDF